MSDTASATDDLSIPPFLDRTNTGIEIARPLADLAARINDEHQAATSALRQGVLHAIAAGDLLLKAKAQLKHGGWLEWLKINCEIPERTVQAYMRLARLPVEKRNAVADLPLREALSAIRSRQERLERAEEQENRPPPGPARICTVGPDGEVLFGEDAIRAMPPYVPPPPVSPEENADYLIRQLIECAGQANVSDKELIAALVRWFDGKLLPVVWNLSPLSVQNSFAVELLEELQRQRRASLPAPCGDEKQTAGQS